MSDFEENYQQKAVERMQQHLSQAPPLNIQEPKHWLILLSIYGILFVLILWSFLGRIPTETVGRSIALSSSGVFLIDAPSTGTITDIYVLEGDKVTTGQPLAKFNNPALRSLLFSIESTKYRVERLTTQAALLEHAWNTNIQLYKKGLIAKMVIDQSRSALMDKRIEIETARADLTKLFTELENNSFVSGKKFLHYKTLLNAPAEVVNFDKILSDLSILTAPSDGKVLEVLVNQNEKIEIKNPVFWMENPPIPGEEDLFFSTVNAQVQGRLKVGSKALIEPAIVNPREYGAIEGVVTQIYPYPVSKEELTQTIGNTQVVTFLLDEKGVMTQVTITPKLDPKTQSGYKWTSKKGPPFAIPTGTVCKTRVIVDEQPPISYLIPLWKIKP